MRSCLAGLMLLMVACGAQARHEIDDAVCAQAFPPPECELTCDPAPGAPVVCPAGFHCEVDGKCDAQCTQGGTECGIGFECSEDGRCEPVDDCVNLECQQVNNCSLFGGGTTQLVGTVYAPNGTLPLYGVNVYVPNAPTGDLQPGAVCARCGDELGGSPLVQTVSAADGTFTLDNVPAGHNIPLVITSGKWRRQIVIPTVLPCRTQHLTPEQTHLPANQSEGDMPLIALSTGYADALECLMRKVGVSDSEFTSATQGGRVHMYADRSAPSGMGTDRFSPGFPGGSGPFSDDQDLWNDVEDLKKYDMVVLSCEGGEYPQSKSQGALDAMKAYADFGGRIFMSHWHNIWIEGGAQEGGEQIPAVWPEIAQWSNDDVTFEGIDLIDEVSNPKGNAFASWMLAVGGSTVRDQIELTVDTGKNTLDGLTPGRAEQWVTWNDGVSDLPQIFQFTTPNESPLVDRCGKVVFSDIHVSGDSSSDAVPPGLPALCSTGPLTPQEKVLAFMIFDLASCVDTIP